MVDLAILFWFYKDPKVTLNHLRLIKRTNPKLKIYGLYGGPRSSKKSFREKLAPLLDSFYATPSQDKEWKWRHGDLAILDWYEKEGMDLKWESIALVQWDMLVFDSLLNWFSDLKKGQIFLSGLRTISKVLELGWYWTSPTRKESRHYREFKKFIKIRFNYSSQLLACLFIFGIFPRDFFEAYRKIESREIGFLEYKVPTYAKIFKIPFYERLIGTYWGDWFRLSGNAPLNALPKEISTSYINKELAKPEGWRFFHPYFKKWEK